MLKNLIQIEHTIEGKTGRFICDNDTPFNIAKELLFQASKYLGQLEDQARANFEAQQAQKKEEQPQE